MNVLSTLVAVFAVDRLGRRKLLLEAGFQMFISEALVAVLLGACCTQGNQRPSVPSLAFVCEYLSLSPATQRMCRVIV